MVKHHIKFFMLRLAGFSILAGCVNPVKNLSPTSFEADALDKNAQGRVVTLLHLLPARAAVSNQQNHQTGELVGATAGATLCAAAGATLGAVFAGTSGGIGAGLGGLALCGIAGYFIGGAVEPPELHPDSLIIIYQDPNDPQIRQTVEIAKPCEFKPGTAYAVILKNPQTGIEETKIQPNNFEACVTYSQRLKQHRAEDKAARKIAEKELKQKHAQKASKTLAALPAGNVTRIDQDGTVLLNGKYLGIVDAEGVVTGLDKSRKIQIFRDGVVKDRTDPENEKILGQVDPDQLEQIRACRNNLPTCKFTHIGW